MARFLPLLPAFAVALCLIAGGALLLLSLVPSSFWLSLLS